MRKWAAGSIFVFICMLAIPAVCLGQAANEEQWRAEQLKQLGLFQGTDQGFELERESSRVEAVVMLIRLLGKEEEALSGTGPGFTTGLNGALEPVAAHPFTDVPAWAERYIAFAYQHGLAAGVADAKFGSGEAVTAAQYYTFVLRALGYEDGEPGDFRWDRALDKAQAVGIAGGGRYADGKQRLTRGDLASISYQSLKANMKGETATLLDELVARGAVKPEQAASLKAEQIARTEDAAVHTGETSAQSPDDNEPGREGTRLRFPVEKTVHENGLTYFRIRSDEVLRLLPTAHHYRIANYGVEPGATAVSLVTSGLVHVTVSRGNGTDNLLSEVEIAISSDEASSANETTATLRAIFDKDQQLLAYAMNDGLTADHSVWVFEIETPDEFDAMAAKAKELSRDAYEFSNTLFYPANYTYTEPDKDGTLVAKPGKTLLLDTSRLPESARGFTKVSWLTIMKGPPNPRFKPIESIEDVDNVQLVLENNRLESLRAQRMGLSHEMPFLGDGTFWSMAQPDAKPISFAFVFLIDEQGKILAYSHYTGAEQERWQKQMAELPQP